MFARHNRLAFTEITSYKADPSLKWLAVTGLTPEVCLDLFRSIQFQILSSLEPEATWELMGLKVFGGQPLKLWADFNRISSEAFID